MPNTYNTNSDSAHRPLKDRDRTPMLPSSEAGSPTTAAAMSGQLRVDALGAVHHAAMVVRTHLEASALRPHDLTWTAFNVLALLQHQGEAQIGQVARQLGVSAGTLTGVAKNLEQRGLIRRKPHPSDRRQVLICLAEEGIALADGLSVSYLAEAGFVTASFSEHDAALLSELLMKLITHVVATSQQRCAVVHEHADLPPRRSRRKRALEKPGGEPSDQPQALARKPSSGSPAAT